MEGAAKTPVTGGAALLYDGAGGARGVIGAAGVIGFAGGTGCC